MRKINEKDLTAKEKKAANCTLTYLGNGIYSDMGIKRLWAEYIKRCKQETLESIVILPL